MLTPRNKEMRGGVLFSLPQGSAGRPERGQGGCCPLKPPPTISLPSRLIYSPPPLHPSETLPLCTHSLPLAGLALALRPGVKTPAARSTGDKSDLPGRVIVKHPPGRLRPPHPFNSSAGVAGEGGVSMRRHKRLILIQEESPQMMNGGRDGEMRQQKGNVTDSSSTPASERRRSAGSRVAGTGTEPATCR